MKNIQTSTLIVFFIFSLSIKEEGKTLITVAFNIRKTYTTFTSATNSIIKGFLVANFII